MTQHPLNLQLCQKDDQVFLEEQIPYIAPVHAKAFGLLTPVEEHRKLNDIDPRKTIRYVYTHVMPNGILYAILIAIPLVQSSR